MRYIQAIFFLLLSGFLLSGQVMAQNTEHTVSGAVIDQSGSPLSNVNIIVRGTTIGTTTDDEGRYKLTVPAENDTLVFSFIGYKVQMVPIKGRTNIDIEMTPKTLIGEELVVTGYQVQKKSTLTGSIGVVDVENIQNTTARNPVKALQGRVPGLIVSTTGAPNSHASVLIRGYSTLGSNEPLYIIDGVPTTGDMVYALNPSTIESMQVLKGASAASIYGSRAANGVIVITTKNGTPGEFDVTYHGQLTTQYYVDKYDPLTTVQRGRVLWEAAINDGINPDNALYDYEWHKNGEGIAVLDRVIVPKWLSKEKGIKTANTNWYDVISRPGVSQSHNLSISTGNKRGSTLLGLRYYKNKGIVKETGYTQLQARINSEYNFFDDRLRLGENLTISNGVESPMPSGLGGTPLWLAMISQSIMPVHTVDGGWAGPVGSGFGDRDNPLRLLKHNRWDKRNTLRIFGNLFVGVDILENLIFESSLGIDYSEFYARDITRTYQTGFLKQTVNSLATFQNHSIDWTWSNTLNYKKEFGQHHFDVLAGIEFVKNVFDEISTHQQGFAIETPDYMYNDAGTGIKNVGGYRTGYSLISYFGKINYNYSDKYLASVTLRYDGSSRFGDKNKFGLFPAFSVGWRLSEEPFIDDNLEFLSNLKIRFGWGRVGNQNIANNAIYSLYTTNYGDDPTWGPSNGTAYDLNGADTGVLPSGFIRTQTGNNRLRWETATEFNLGLDFGLFEQHLTGSASLYYRTTTDILIRPPFLGAVGYGGGQWVNGATVESKGFGVSMSYQDRTDGFYYSITANLSAFRDEITKLPPSVVDAYPGNDVKNILGRSQKSLFGYVANGLFDTMEEVKKHAKQPGAGLGRIRYKDLNDDGVITPRDQKFIGVARPDFTFGFNANMSYKNFSVTLFLQGIQGMEVYNSLKIYTDFTSMWGGANYGSRTLDAWTLTNKDSSIPALTRSDTNDEDRSSTYFIEDGSYLKLRSLQIAYTFDKSILESLHLDNLRLYIRGENLLTFKDNSGPDKYTGTDPENPENIYPRPLKISVGLDISL